MLKLVYAIGGTGLLQVANLVTGVMIARLLGPTYRGELSQIVAWYSFLSPICLLGLNDAVIFFRARGDDAGHVLRTAFVGMVLTVAVALIACLTAKLTVLQRLSPDGELGAWLFLAFAPGYQLSQVITSYFQASQQTKLWTFLRISAGPFYVIFILVAAFTHHATVSGIVIANLCSVLVSIVVGGAFAWRAVVRSAPVRVENVRRFFNYGAALTLQRVAISGASNLDRMILPFFISSAALGNYVVAATMAYLVYIVGFSIDLIAFPTVVRAGEGEEKIETAEAFLCLCVYLTVAAVIFLALAAPPLVTILFGRAYGGAVALVPVFLVAGGLQAIRMVFGGVFKAFAQSGALGFIEAVSTVIMVIVLFTAGPILGASAGALAHVMSAVAGCSIAAWLGVRRIGLRPLAILIPSRRTFTRVLQIAGG